MSHFVILTVFALIVSTVFALLQDKEPSEQLRYGAFTFACFVASAFVIGWLMYPFPS